MNPHTRSKQWSRWSVMLTVWHYDSKPSNLCQFKSNAAKQSGWKHDHPSQLSNRHRRINFFNWACRGCIHQWMADERAPHQPSRLWAFKPSQCNNKRTATGSDPICLQRTQTSSDRLRTNGEPAVTVPVLKIHAHMPKKLTFLIIKPIIEWHHPYEHSQVRTKHL